MSLLSIFCLALLSMSAELIFTAHPRHHLCKTIPSSLVRRFLPPCFRVLRVVCLLLGITLFWLFTVCSLRIRLSLIFLSTAKLISCFRLKKQLFIMTVLKFSLYKINLKSEQLRAAMPLCTVLVHLFWCTCTCIFAESTPGSRLAGS